MNNPSDSGAGRAFDWSDAAPNAEEYVALRQAAGLGERSADGARIGLPASLFIVTVREAGTLVAMGRVIGDGGCFALLADVAVAPEAQGCGLGSGITSKLVDWCEAHLPATCHISLVASPRALKLYEAFGFEETSGMDRYADPTLRLTVPK